MTEKFKSSNFRELITHVLNLYNLQQLLTHSPIFLTKQALVSKISHRNDKLFCTSSARDIQNSSHCAYYVRHSREYHRIAFYASS